MLIAKIRRRILMALDLYERSQYLSKSQKLSNYDIGEWTYGSLKVRSWSKGGSLKVGRFCSMARGVSVYLGGEHRVDWVSSFAFPTLWAEAEGTPGWPHLKGDVVIGNDVWIGEDAVIMSGVTIGDGAVIGARSVVRKDVPPYGTVAGNPGRVAGYRFNKDTIQDLLEIAWWDWPIERIKEALPLMLSADIQSFVERYGVQPGTEGAHEAAEAPEEG